VRDTLIVPPARTQVPLRHLTGPRALDRALIEQLLERASAFEQGNEIGARRLQGRLLATIFYEPSTRTRFSFEAAMHRLGGQVLSAENATKASSAAKGESLEDAIRVIGGYADGIVLRHPDIGAADRAARVAQVPVISAGDGAGHHPTQALLDLYTIKKELGRLDHLRIGLAGDLRNGRTVRSLALLLSRFSGNELVLISPPGLRLGDDIVHSLEQAQQRVRQTGDFGAAIPTLDVLYQTRIQAERFESPEEYERYRGVYVVTAEVMRQLPEKAIVMHPLPRVAEIDPIVDADPRAAYFRQARNGLWMRMAVLDWAMAR
jgi:aspartate carbamoyltransferase catalytic subunit